MQRELTSSGELTLARLDRLPPTKTIWRLVLLLSLGFFFELYDLMFTAYVAPGLVKSGILTATTSGMFGTTGVATFVAATFAGLLVGTLFCGHIADKYGRRAVFTYSLIWYTAANTIMAFQDTAFSINLWRFISGIGIGVELVTIGAYISELVPKSIRGRAFACEQAVGFVAVPVVALLSYLLVPSAPLGMDGWRWLVLIGSSSALFVWWMRRQLPESPRWLVQVGRYEEAERIVSMLELKVREDYKRELPEPLVCSNVVARASIRELLKRPYLSRTIMMSVFNFFAGIGFYGFASWVPTLLIKQGMTLTTSLGYSSLIACAAPIGPLIGLLIADRYERKTVLVVMAGTSLLAGLFFSQSTTAIAIISIGIILTLSNNILAYSFHAYQNELFPTGLRSRAVGFVYSWSRLSAIFTGFFVAAILANYGVTGVFLFISAAYVIVALVIGLLGPRTRNLSLETISN